MEPKESEPSRPAELTALGILAILAGLFGFLIGAFVIMSPDPLVGALSAMALLIGFLYVVAGVGFLQVNPRAWTLGLIVSLLSLVRNLVEAVTRPLFFALPGIFVPIVVIYYLTRPQVRALFSKDGAHATNGHRAGFS